MSPSHLQPRADVLAHQPTSIETTSTPTRPRKMIERESRITKLESAVLYPRLVLLEALTGFKDKPKQRAKSGDTRREARRDFLDSFAYLCDVEKGGKTVTATGLQRLENDNQLWLAANESVRDDIFIYANTILEQIKSATAETQSTIQDRIMALSVEKCKPRIQVYKTAVQELVRNCRMALRRVKRDDFVNHLRTRLTKLSEPSPNMSLGNYVDLCYTQRDECIDAIKLHSRNMDDDFSKLAHFVYRIGATREAANKVVEAMIHVPSLQQISWLQTVRTPEIVKKTMSPACMSPHEVFYGVLEETNPNDPLKFQQAFLRLFHLDSLPTRPIYNHMALRETIRTRIHAELQIADKFARSQAINFVDDDKYIGCSKPACYFCYTWLCLHTQGYSEPETHCKFIPGCRGPDYELNDAGTDVMISMYSKISQQVGQDIFAFLEKDTPPPRVPYMSTDAGSRAPSRMSGF